MPISAGEAIPGDAILYVRNLSAGYGKIGVLSGIRSSSPSEAGERVTLLGPQLARARSRLLTAPSPWLAAVEGRTSRSTANSLRRRRRQADLEGGIGARHRRRTPDFHPAVGLGQSAARPATTCRATSAASRIEEALSFFPEMREKRLQRGCTGLSGGQQQMLAVAQGLQSGVTAPADAG